MKYMIEVQLQNGPMNEPVPNQGHVWHGVNFKYKAMKADGTVVWKNEYMIQVLTNDVKKDALTTLSLLKCKYIHVYLGYR